jgi:hypothetical protein
MPPLSACYVANDLKFCLQFSDRAVDAGCWFQPTIGLPRQVIALEMKQQHWAATTGRNIVV